MNYNTSNHSKIEDIMQQYLTRHKRELNYKTLFQKNGNWGIIGISGVARAGKDSFCDILFEELLVKKKYNIFKLRFAESLKLECKDVLQNNFGVDVLTNDTRKKEFFRDFLTIWADMRRKETSGLYFVNRVLCEIKKRMDNLYLFSEKNIIYDKTIFLIPDLRFKEFSYDELDFVYDNGLVVHIKQILNKAAQNSAENNNFDENLVEFQPPANKFEAENDPKIEAFSDFKVQWPKFSVDAPEKMIMLPEAKVFIQEFITKTNL